MHYNCLNKALQHFKRTTDLAYFETKIWELKLKAIVALNEVKACHQAK